MFHGSPGSDRLDQRCGMAVMLKDEYPDRSAELRFGVFVGKLVAGFVDAPNRSWRSIPITVFCFLLSTRTRARRFGDFSHTDGPKLEPRHHTNMIGTNTPLPTLANITAKSFQKRFGTAPRWIAAAPGRVNLIGEHTDYNDGFVFPMALERYTVIAAAPNGSDTITITSGTAEGAATIDLSKSIERSEPSWANYVKGVIVEFQRLGCKIPGFNAHIESTVPLGGGVSSSAALEVATATLLEAITHKKLTQVQKGLLAQKAEHEFALMPCGIMDQFISVMGKADHVLLLDCESRKTKLVPMKSKAVAILVINTNVKHELTGSEYPDRRPRAAAVARPRTAGPPRAPAGLPGEGARRDGPPPTARA